MTSDKSHALTSFLKAYYMENSRQVRLGVTFFLQSVAHLPICVLSFRVPTNSLRQTHAAEIRTTLE